MLPKLPASLLIAASLSTALLGQTTHEDSVVVPGIGTIALPPGQWTLEHAVTPQAVSDEPDVYVFRKKGRRLERLTIQKFGPHIARPIGAYFDSIGDSMSNGIPIHLLDNKSQHDTIEILRPIFDMAKSGEKAICQGASFVYTCETKDPWMSHAFVCDCEGSVVVCIHSSPHAISPETVQYVFSETKFDEDPRSPVSAESDKATPAQFVRVSSQDQEATPRVEQADHLKVTIYKDAPKYDKNAKLLTVPVELWNKSDQTIHIVTTSYYGFTHLDYENLLRIDSKGDSITFDHAFLPFSKMGAKAAGGAEFMILAANEYFELAPNKNQHVTCVYQFPMRLDYGYSDDRRFEEPIGKKWVSLRFGFITESHDDFRKRHELYKNQTAAERNLTLVSQWQKVVETKPFLIDFGAPDAYRGLPLVRLEEIDLDQAPRFEPPTRETTAEIEELIGELTKAHLNNKRIPRDLFASRANFDGLWPAEKLTRTDSLQTKGSSQMAPMRFLHY